MRGKSKQKKKKKKKKCAANGRRLCSAPFGIGIFPLLLLPPSSLRPPSSLPP